MTIELTPIELRVLRYLDQRGACHRHAIAADLASPDSRLGRGYCNGSNGAIPLIVGRWTRRLIAAGLVRVRSDPRGFYQCHEITDAGRAFLRGEQ